MAFQASTAELLGRLEKAVESKLEDGWAAEPPAARAALLVREELAAWTRTTYPGSACDGSALDPGSRRRLALTIHSAPVSHRVEVWGLACGDDAESVIPVGEHVAHSWVVLAHVGGPCKNLDARVAKLTAAGLRRLEERLTPRFALSLWMGAAAPDGCPACLAKG
ncbi:MAG TPA: hypothetical protein VF950_05475 [Planctomycetota bacterium]